MSNWTQEQRDIAKGQLRRISQCDDFEPFNCGVSYNSELIDLACQRNELLDALKAIIAGYTPYGSFDGQVRIETSEERFNAAHDAIAKAEVQS